MGTHTYRARPSDSGLLEAAIDAMVMRSVSTSGATLAQQRADALLELVSGGGSSVTAEVVVHVVQHDDGRILAALADGTPIPASQASELLCEASIRALVHDSQGKPIDASPSRPAPTKRQMRLLMARDQHCQHPGCRVRSFLHAHHVQWRSRGGPTIISNLILLCSFHHTMLHQLAGTDG